MYQRKDSRWEAAGYVLAPGNTRKEALAKLTEKIAASNRGSPMPSAKGSVAAYLTYWLENVAVHHLRENTHIRYTAVTRLYLIPGLGRKKLAKLTAKDVRTWVNQLRTTCQCCARGLDAAHDQPLCCAAGKCCSKRLSPLTLAYVHSVLKSALEHAVREEEIPRNVARNVRTGTPRPRRFEPLTADEARHLLTATRGHRLRTLFELALHTGLRKGELLALGRPRPRRRHRRHPPNPPAHQHRRTHHAAHQDPGLRAPYRPPHPLLQSLKLHHEQQQREREAAGTTWRHHGHVFTTVQGRPIDPTNLTRAFTTLLRKAGLRRIRFHDLRHSTATLLLEQGVELVVIKELLGHAHIGVTATVYAHVRLRLQREAIDTLGTTLGSRETTETASSDDESSPSAVPVPLPVR